MDIRGDLQTLAGGGCFADEGLHPVEVMPPAVAAVADATQFHDGEGFGSLIVGVAKVEVVAFVDAVEAVKVAESLKRKVKRLVKV